MKQVQQRIPFVISNAVDADGLLLCGCDNHEDGCILDDELFAELDKFEDDGNPNVD